MAASRSYTNSLYSLMGSGVRRPLEGQAQSRTGEDGGMGIIPPRLGGITIHNFITVLCHVGFSILQVV